MSRSATKVIDVIKTAAAYLELPDEVFGGVVSEGMRNADLDKLIRCFNSVVSEIAEEYAPFVKEENVVTLSGVIPYALFSERICKLEYLKQNGVKVRFKCLPGHVKPETEGTFEARYRYLPPALDIDGEIDMPLNISDRIVALGVAAEYALIVERYEESVKFGEKYMEAMKHAVRCGREIIMPKRSFR